MELLVYSIMDLHPYPWHTHGQLVQVALTTCEKQKPGFTKRFRAICYSGK